MCAVPQGSCLRSGRSANGVRRKQAGYHRCGRGWRVPRRRRPGAPRLPIGNEEFAMTRWYEGPLAAFDTETTGVDVEQDRIVSAALIVQECAGGRVRSTR